MPSTAIMAYLERLPARIAELKLVIAEGATVPHMKENARSSTIRAWTRMANHNEDVGEVVTPARLKLLGIGVRYVQ